MYVCGGVCVQITYGPILPSVCHLRGNITYGLLAPNQYL